MKINRNSHWYQSALFRCLVIGLSFCIVFSISYKLNQIYLDRAASLVDMVVTRREIYPGQQIIAADLIVSKRPVFGLGNNYIQNLDEFIQSDTWYVGEVGLGKGDILRPDRLTKDANVEKTLMDLLDQEGKRLIAVETDLIRSCAGLIEPGTKVDAMVFIKGREGYETIPDQIIGPQEDPNLQDLLVVDKKNSNGKVLGNEIDTGIGSDNLPVVVTLMLDETEIDKAKALIRYNEQGKIYFSPNSLEDYQGVL